MRLEDARIPARLEVPPYVSTLIYYHACDDLRMPTRYKMSTSVRPLPHTQSDSSQLNRKCNDSDILMVFAGRKDEDLDAIVRATLAWE